jgi:SAM-dependent methyltransferase
MSVEWSSTMVATDKLFAGSIPEIYDCFLVPLIFEPYARDLAERLAKLDPRDVLETAAGTGVLTRAMASRVPHARIVATDLNQPMLDQAAARGALEERIALRQADALALPFDDQTFDVVTCQFGVMFFPDKVQGYNEARRVLKPGGRFVFNVWDRISENNFADVVTQALADFFPHDPPRFLARVPHGYHDEECIPAIAYCQGTPLRTEIEARDASRLQDATRRAADALAHRFGSGAIEGRIRAFVVTAVS